MSKLLRLLATASSLVLAGCQSALYSGINLLADDTGVVEHRDIVFDPVHQLALDVYRPERPRAGAPVVVFFYGGSWRNGERGWNAFVGRALARNGVIAVIPDYRKAPQVRFPAFVEDGARAVAWTRTHAGRYGADPARLHLMGHSAGAHIAAMLGADGRFLDAVGLAPADLDGVVGLAGPYDFLPIGSRRLAEVFGPVEDHPASQPVNFVDGDEPPFLLLQGLDDRVVIPRNARRLSARLAEHGVAVERHEYPGVGHPGILLALARPARSQAPVLADVLAFLEAAGTDAPGVAGGQR
jgi:acetyl esterase/lipase